MRKPKCPPTPYPVTPKQSPAEAQWKQYIQQGAIAIIPQEHQFPCRREDPSQNRYH